MVERQLPKLNVAGSIPVSRSILKLSDSSDSGVLKLSPFHLLPILLPNCQWWRHTAGFW